RNLGDWAGAIDCWERTLTTPGPRHFASVHPGIRGDLTRQNLAVLYQEHGMLRQAETHWRRIHERRPEYEPAWRGLVEVCRRQQRWDDLARLGQDLAETSRKPLLLAVLRGRVHLARREFDRGQQVLTPAVTRFPSEPEPRLLLSYILLQEGR